MSHKVITCEESDELLHRDSAPVVMGLTNFIDGKVVDDRFEPVNRTVWEMPDGQWLADELWATGCVHMIGPADTNNDDDDGDY